MDISLAQALPVPEVEVFRGTAASCSEQALVLDAKGFSYRLIATDSLVLLMVGSNQAAEAAEELARYAAERIERPEPRPRFVPFAGGFTGALVYAAVLIAVAFFAGQQQFGADWFGMGALDSDANSVGEWWRSITALTLHLDLEHLLGNLLFGAGIGIFAARMFGPGVAWLSILSCAAVANYADMLMSPATHRAIGASTAVFAGLGILAGFGWGRAVFSNRQRSVYRWGPLFGGVFLLVFLGAGVEHVDVLGHVLGFAVGVVAGFAFTRTGLSVSRSRFLQLATGLMALGSVISAWMVAFRAAD